MRTLPPWTRCWRQTSGGAARSPLPTPCAPSTRRSAGRSGKAHGPERAELLAHGKQLSADVKAAEAEQLAAEDALDAAHRAVPNLIVEGVPAGGEDDFEVLKHVGRPAELGFEAKDHLELGTALGLIDTERGAKVSGARFYFLTGLGAQLQLGLLQLAVQQAVAAGFTLMIPPVLVRPEIMEGTGFLGAHAAEVYRLRDDDLHLVGTSEVPLAGYHAEEISTSPPGRAATPAGRSASAARPAPTERTAPGRHLAWQHRRQLLTP